MSGPERPVLVIRPYAPADREAVIEQVLGLNRHEEPLARNRRTDLAGAVASFDEAMSAVSETGGAALVAELGGRVVGHLFLVVAGEAAFVREELRAHGHVSDLFVREEVRGAGIGKALMAEAERLAAARGLARLSVGALAGNAAARRLYERLGFAPHAVTLRKPIGPE